MVTTSQGNQDTEKAVQDHLFQSQSSTIQRGLGADNRLFLILEVKVVFSAQIQKTNGTRPTDLPDKVFTKRNLKNILQTKNKR